MSFFQVLAVRVVLIMAKTFIRCLVICLYDVPSSEIYLLVNIIVGSISIIYYTNIVVKWHFTN